MVPFGRLFNMALSLDGTTGIISANIQDGTITGSDIASSTITASNIASSTITPAKLAQPLTLGTAVAISGNPTSVDFNSIPSWAKRITVTFDNVSTSGTSTVQIQIGSGSYSTSGYTAGAAYLAGAAQNSASATSGFVSYTVPAASTQSGSIVLTLLSSNIWTCMGILVSGTELNYFAGVSPSLSGALDRVRITTVNGTDTFDAGTVNIMYE